ncbi:hypothetical protein LOZ07_003586 [Ophidiomyces ophidiicola]|uniref:Uncharacterized protein n=1 Tax=Ophidiomyces ophidiicola TaxID=1387563 RepID=A0ACB8UUE0_9EURO|nr:hypothetical protein LOZ56_001501 [Ophidiomyces ophidiicola]KAI2040756.1 hypothetical protein LOZ47_001129 [Ophidiomyces ophidiicola]KAI2104067.1 hypothetical protein LOZ33_000655 [Ophidiomyces ophidiicola]KAI2129449.1 hypothetical protein LOZ31_001469 [Ophidiomyces ophidiicola]KAI2198047.1 hypothetical protein LOZ20_002531 [Ophidiomyces ophidiicola]
MPLEQEYVSCDAHDGGPDLCMPTCRGVQIEELSIVELQQHLTEGTFSARELTASYLLRIERINSILKAVIETNPDALDIAGDLDSERLTGKIRSPLHGIPFLVKDNMGTGDKMQTTAGSSVLAGATTPEANVVSLMRQTGAVLLGHANLSEWASMRSSYYLGTETDGSVIFPADRNGIVGLKPTVGLVSTKGIIPEASSMDTVGPMGRSVQDVAVVMDAMTGKFQTGNRSTVTYSSFISQRDALKGARFGLPWQRVWKMASENEKLKIHYETLKAVIADMKSAGAEIFEGADFPSAKEIIPPTGWDWLENTPGVTTRIGGSLLMPNREYAPEDKPYLSEFNIVRTEFYNGLQEYLSNLITNPNQIKTLEDVVAYNQRHAEAEGGYPNIHPCWPSGQDNFEKSVGSKGTKNEQYREALTFIQQKSRKEGIDAALYWENSKLDGLLVPIQAENGVACQVAAKAGMSTSFPFIGRWMILIVG